MEEKVVGFVRRKGGGRRRSRDQQCVGYIKTRPKSTCHSRLDSPCKVIMLPLRHSVCTTTVAALLLLLPVCRVLSEDDADADAVRQAKEYSSYSSYSSNGNQPGYSKPLYSGYYTGSSGSGTDATWGSVHPVDEIKPGPPSPPSWQTPSYPPDKVVISYPPGKTCTNIGYLLLRNTHSYVYFTTIL